MTDAVDLFAGAGGFSVACRWLGLSEVGVESWIPALRTRAANGLQSIGTDVRNVEPLLEPKYLLAGPPCQSFSVTGRKVGLGELAEVIDAIKHLHFSRKFQDERTGLVLQPLRWITHRAAVEAPFRGIALEQVPTVLPIWEAYAETLEYLGYNCVTGILRAEDYGVPQTRSRAVLLARLEGHPVLPMPTTFTPVGFAEALGLEGDWSLVSNNTSQQHRDRRSVRHSPAPSFTLTGKCTRMHVVPGHVDPPRSVKAIQGRNITIQEAGILQSFPIDFVWAGSKDEQQQQIGNACPPLMAQAMIKEIM
jgi:DNA (cytosine-5)-methyltransferase 1